MTSGAQRLRRMVALHYVKGRLHYEAANVMLTHYRGALKLKDWALAIARRLPTGIGQLRPIGRGRVADCRSFGRRFVDQADEPVGELQLFDVDDGVGATDLGSAGMRHVMRLRASVPKTCWLPEKTSVSIPSAPFTVKKCRTMPSWLGLSLPENTLAGNAAMLLTTSIGAPVCMMSPAA